MITVTKEQLTQFTPVENHEFFKYQINIPFIVKSRYDNWEFWRKLSGTTLYHGNKKLCKVDEWGILVFPAKGGMMNGLTCHRDHKWALRAAYAHDIWLKEGYGGRLLTKYERQCIDRLFLSVLLDTAEQMKGKWKRRLYKSFSYGLYIPVAINTNLQYFRL